MSSARRLLAGLATTMIAASLVTGCGGDDGGGTPDAGGGNVTISKIADQMIDEDGTTGSIAFTVTASADLTASSSNKMVVPDASVVLGGTGGNRTVTINPAKDQFGTTTITITARVGSRTASTSFMVTVKAVNDPPTLSDFTDKTTEEGTALAAIPFTVGDVETAPAMLTVTATSDNTMLIGAAGLVLGGTGANRTLTVSPANSGTGSATITVKVSDGTADVMKTFKVTVSVSNAVNDPPANTVPGAQSRPENTNLVFGAAGNNAISVLDPDAGNNPIKVTLAVTGGIGALSLAVTSGLTFSAGDGMADTTMTFTGTISAVNTGLNGLTLAPPAGFSGTGMVTITTNDQGNTGSGGPQQDVDSVQVTFVAVNDPPTIAQISDKTIMEDGSTGSLGFTIADTDTPVGMLAVTRESSNTDVIPLANVVLGGTGGNRTVTVTPAPDKFGSSVITISVFDGEVTTTMSFMVIVTAVEDPPTISATPDQSINAGEMRVIEFTVGDAETPAAMLTVAATQAGTPALTLVTGGTGADRTLTVTAPANMNGTVTITLTVTDGAMKTTSDSFMLAVNNVNDPPVLTVPTAQVLHTDGGASGIGTLAFTSENQITVADDDIGTADMTLRLQATSGITTTGALPTNTTRTAGADGSADQTLSGPVDEINEVLDGLLFTSSPGFSGDASLKLTVNDGGATGTGGPQMDSETIAITVNVKPTITAIADQVIDEDDDTGNLPFTIGDFEQGTQGLTVTATSSNLELVPASGVVLGGTTGARNIKVTPVADKSGKTTIEITVVDSDGGERSVSFDVTVTPVNDAPVLVAPADATGTEDVALVFDGTLSVSDVDDTVLDTVTLEAGNGTVTLASTVGLTFTVGDGEDDAVVTFSGKISDVNAALDGASFIGDQDYNGDATLDVTVSDGALMDTANIAIDVVAANDAPVITTTEGLETLNRNQTRNIELTVSDVDVTPAQDVEVTLVVSGNATLSMQDISGLTFTSGDGTDDTMMTFHGNLANVNDALSGAGSGIDQDPMQGFEGDIVLTATVSDLGHTGPDGTKVTTHTFVTTHAAGNTAPTISTINSRTIDEDSAGNTASFTVGDAQTSPGNLEVTVTTTGSGADPVEVTWTLGGSGANRTLTVVPKPNDHGKVTIDITVSDGALMATESYDLTVNAVNDRPVIEPETITVEPIDEDGTVEVTFLASDPDGTTPTMDISSDNTTLLPNSSFTGLTTSKVTIKPVADKSGTATVKLTASDGMLMETREFVVTVLAVNDPPVISGTYPNLEVSDIEVGGATYEVRIEATGGTVTLKTIADLNLIVGDGNQEAKMVFRGQQDAVNAALDGLIDSVTNGTIVIEVSDLGVAPATEDFPEGTASVCVAHGTGTCN